MYTQVYTTFSVSKCPCLTREGERLSVSVHVVSGESRARRAAGSCRPRPLNHTHTRHQSTHTRGYNHLNLYPEIVSIYLLNNMLSPHVRLLSQSSSEPEVTVLSYAEVLLDIRGRVLISKDERHISVCAAEAASSQMQLNEGNH